MGMGSDMGVRRRVRLFSRSGSSGFALILILGLCLAAARAFSADHDNNIVYRDGETMKIQSTIGVEVELLGNGAGFEVVDKVGNGGTAFKVNRVADGLKSLEVGGESVSNLVVEIAEDVCRRRNLDSIVARLETVEVQVRNLSALASNLQETVTALQQGAIAGVRHDVFLTAKDMAGNTNITMRTMRRSDGSAASSHERLLPGTYNWVWDAAADLPEGFVCDQVVVEVEAQ